MNTIMSLPTQIKVGPFTFKVMIKDMEDFGTTDFNKFEICIKEGMDPVHEREIFNHEILHCCAFLGRPIPLPMEEKFVRAISPIYYDAILNNPQVKAYLYDTVVPF